MEQQSYAKSSRIQNRIINHAIAEEYDYLFLIDSDIIIHPYLIEHLKSQGKDILSELHWTRWHFDEAYAPNVWLYDQYGLAPREYGEFLNEEETVIRRSQFFNQLRVPGVYEVGGVCACTLFSREALTKGVNFQPIKNLYISGEDRFLCVRAAVLGVGIFVDTYYPGYHIYRESDLAGVEEYVKSCRLPDKLTRHFKSHDNKLTLSMVVKNESQRYLKEVLTKLNGVIDEAVIIDDASTDNTVQMCYELLTGIPVHVIRNEESMFGNEINLRKKQWEETIKTNPDWILNIDADEIFEDSFYKNVRDLINQESIDLYAFRLYDMWDENHYRNDTYWHAHDYYREFLYRYQPNFTYEWLDQPHHCGRMPKNIYQLPSAVSEIRVKHYGWAKKEDRISKYERYKKYDPDSVYGVKGQYDSILDENPTLVEWVE